MNFGKQAFSVFEQTQLKDRMSAIKEEIHPSFQYFGEQIAKYLRDKENKEIFIHIAKHLRRTTNPPESTWVAIGGDKRGYKKYPHFQIGINEEYVFIVLAIIDNPLFEKEIARKWSAQLEWFYLLPSDYVVIPDHTQLTYISRENADFDLLLKRLESIKKAEFMIGRVLKRGDLQLDQQEMIEQWLIESVNTLYPKYNEAMEFYS